jgi:hypothetical protein
MGCGAMDILGTNFLVVKTTAKQTAAAFDPKH